MPFQPDSNRSIPAALVRVAVLAALPLILAACSTAMSRPGVGIQATRDPAFISMYASLEDDDGTVIPAIDVSKIDKRNLRQVVNYETYEPVGTIVVDPYARFLYLVMENGKAMRYGVGVAKAGLEFAGEADISRKASWPSWTPTADMIKRSPERYAHAAGGMEGGLDNPLGARALYLYQDGKDTLYRIHGTTEPWSIGQSVSSGCIRLFNHDIVDLYERVPKGTRVVVLAAGRFEEDEDLGI